MIPRILHRIWLGSPVPAWARDVYGSWERLHPDWEHQLWTEQNLPALRNQALYDDAELVCGDVGNPWQIRSDVLRYEILLNHGGVYVDCDFEALRPIDSLCKSRLGRTGFLPWEQDRVWIGNTIVAAEPNTAWLERVVSELPASADGVHGAAATIVTGPQFLTRLRLHRRPDVAIFPRSYFFPFGYKDIRQHARTTWEASKVRYPNAYAVHWWMNQRTRRGVAL